MRFATAVALTLCALAWRSPASSSPLARASALSESRYHVERHALGNGLVVLLHEDHSVPTVTFWQWFKVGSRNEHPASPASRTSSST